MNKNSNKLFKLKGFLVDFISTPVISAFTSAAAISIAATQLKGLLGLSFSANGFLEEIKGNIENITKIKWEDTVVAIISLALLYILMASFLINIKSI